MPSPDNKELLEKINQVDRKVERKHKSMLATINNLKNDIHLQLQPFRDYLVGQEAIEKARVKSSDIHGVSISKEVWGFIKLLAIIIAVLVGASQFIAL